MLLTPPTPPTPRRSRWWTAAVALAVVGVGVGAGLLLGPARTPQPRRTPVPASAAPTRPSASLPPTGGAPPVAEPVQIPVGGAYLGVYTKGPNGNPAALAAFQRLVGQPVAIDHEYYRWDQPFPTAAGRESVADGHIPLWNWQSRLLDNRKVTWAAIADGSQDPLIDARARAIAAFGHPVFLAFQHEPEALAGTGPGKEGTPAEYQAAWRHLVTRFRVDRVRNVSWVWILTAHSFRTPGVADSYYPGDSYVDWVAADGYNFFGCKPRVTTSWQTPADIFGSFYAWTAAHPKPAMIGEWGSVEDPAMPGRKAQWISQAEQTFRHWPRIKAYVYFNASPACANQVDTSASSLAAFQRLAADRYFQVRTANP